MAEQNRYQITVNYQRSETGEWSGWTKDVWWEAANTWQYAIKNMLESAILDGEIGLYQVLSETPAADGQSGIIEIQFDPPTMKFEPPDYYAIWRIKATP